MLEVEVKKLESLRSENSDNVCLAQDWVIQQSKLVELAKTGATTYFIKETFCMSGG